MRVNTRVVIRCKTLAVTDRQSYEYIGPVAHCGGGGGSVDKKFNARMASVAERQQNIADKYFNFWSKHQRPYEAKQLAYNTKLLPHEFATETKKLETERRGYETAQKGYGLVEEEMDVRSAELRQAAPVMEEYYKQALEGVDVGEETARARADVAQGLEETERETARQMGRLGVDVSSPAYAERMKATGMEKAKAVGSAMSQARTSATDRSFGMLAQATSQFKTSSGLPK